MTSIIAQNSEKCRILKTKDYSLFKINEKVKVKKIQLQLLIDAMKIKNLSKDIPIIIDENYNILDGKYRFLANKELGTPIFYKIAEVGNSIDFAVAKDMNLKMSIKEYAIFHDKNINYRRLLDSCSKLPFAFPEFTRYVTGIINNRLSKIYDQFKRGEFLYLKEYDYKVNQITEVLKLWQETYGDNYSLSLDDIKSIIEYSQYYYDVVPNNQLCEAIKDHTGYIKKWLHIFNTEGYSMLSNQSMHLSNVIDEIIHLLDLDLLNSKKYIQIDKTKLTYKKYLILDIIDNTYSNA